MVMSAGAAVALLLIAPCVGALQLPPSVSSLPIASVLDSILHTLSNHRSAVLQAPPGAGKSHTTHIFPTCHTAFSPYVIGTYISRRTQDDTSSHRPHCPTCRTSHSHTAHIAPHVALLILSYT